MPSPAISDPVDFAKPIDISKVRNKTALVTGGASGIGAGIVKALAQAGAYVTIVDLNQEAGEEYAKQVTEQGFKYDEWRASESLCLTLIAVLNSHKRASQLGNLR